tara:strand:+ start:3414 stop:3638 length:225 start_codon:yes stop_codon:yes gene_type:complete
MAKRKLIPTDQPGYMKDKHGIIINTNDSHYQKILHIRAEKKKEEELVERMDIVESEMKDIKRMLSILVDRTAAQ